MSPRVLGKKEDSLRMKHLVLTRRQRNENRISAMSSCTSKVGPPGPGRSVTGEKIGSLVNLFDYNAWLGIPYFATDRVNIEMALSGIRREGAERGDLYQQRYLYCLEKI